MRNLYFINSNNEKRLIQENVDPKTIIHYIEEYIANLNPNFKIYYIRTWEEDGGTMYDVGSHSEFFFMGN